MLNSPISFNKLEQIIELLDLTPESRVLDIGCGEGDLLRRIYKKFNAECHGVDPDEAALERCRQEERSEKLILHASTGADFQWPTERFDLAVCIGSSHAFEGFAPTLKVLRNHIRPGGLILMGDLYWRKQPDPEYRDFLGEGWPSFDTDHHSYVSIGENEGLVSLYSVRSSEDEWDHFEGLFTMKNLKRALAITDDKARAKELTKRMAWRDAYLKWGHSTIGFGLYLYQKPKCEQDSDTNS